MGGGSIRHYLQRVGFSFVSIAWSSLCGFCLKSRMSGAKQKKPWFSVMVLLLFLRGVVACWCMALRLDLNG